MKLTAPDGTAFAGEYAGAREPGFAVRRWCLDRALLDCARSAGVEVREGVRARDVVARTGSCAAWSWRRPAAGAPRGTPGRGADGRRSVIARKLGLLREHRTLRKFAVRGYWKGVEGLTDHGEMHVTRGGYCGVAPLGRGEANVTVRARPGRDAAGGRRPRGLLPPHARPLAAHCASGWSAPSLTSPPARIGPLALEARRVSAPGGRPRRATPPDSTIPSRAKA
jgi:flavin-dependent dehydrogenase